MRDQRNGTYNRKFAGKIYGCSKDQLDISLAGEQDILDWLSLRKKHSI